MDLGDIAQHVPPLQDGAYQRAVLGVGERSMLAKNPDLHPEVWMTLWKRAPREDATSLLSHPLREDLALHAAKTARRISDLEALVRYSALSAEASEAVLGSRHMRESITSGWLLQELPTECRDRILAAASPMSRIHYLRRNAARLTSDDVLRQVTAIPRDRSPETTVGEWTTHVRRVVSSVLVDHPVLLPQVAALGRFDTSVAGSRHLTPEVLNTLLDRPTRRLLEVLAVLVHNPMVPRDTIEAALDEVASDLTSTHSYSRHSYEISQVRRSLHERPQHLGVPYEEVSTKEELDVATGSFKWMAYLQPQDLDVLLDAPLDDEAAHLFVSHLVAQSHILALASRDKVERVAERTQVALAVQWKPPRQPDPTAEQVRSLVEDSGSLDVFEVVLALLPTFQGSVDELVEAARIIVR